MDCRRKVIMDFSLCRASPDKNPNTSRISCGLLPSADGKGIFLNMARIHGLSPGMRTALAAQFSRLNPPSIGRGPKNLSGSGKTIYDDGMPEANVPACSACHGPQAEGEREIPRLAGQLYPYLIRQLANWNRERQNEAAAIMEPIAHGLTRSQMEAVAAYVSSLR